MQNGLEAVVAASAMRPVCAGRDDPVRGAGAVDAAGIQLVHDRPVHPISVAVPCHRRHPLADR